MRIVATSIAIAAIAAAAPARADQTQVSSSGSNPGGLQMYVHVPASLPSGAPLVVVLHGCTQIASSMESAGWDALADQYGFAVVYPQQTSTNNPLENVGTTYWIEPELSIGLRYAIYADQVSGATSTTGNRSLFVTARLTLD